MARKTTAEWVDLLKEADIPMTPVRTPDDVLKDPHLAALDFFHRDAHPSEGEVRTIGIPVTFSRNMIAGIRQNGGNPRYTEYPGVGHDVWLTALKEPGLVDWLFAQHR